MLRILDDLVIDRFNSFCHWTQRWFGIKSGTWQRLSLCCALICMGTKEVPHDWGTSTIWLDALICLCYVADIFASLFPTPALTPNQVFRNPRRLQNQIIRPVALVVASVLLLPVDIHGYGSLWFQFGRLAEYFGVCDDLPPGTSKVRKFITALSTSVPSPATETPV
jgi:hypothetical protein